MNDENQILVAEATGTTTLGRANESEAWAASWVTHEMHGDVDPISGYSPIAQHGSLALWKVVEESINPRGLGALRLYFAEVRTTGGYDPSALAGFVADSIDPGRTMSFNRYKVRELVESLPTRYAVRDIAEEMLQQLGALESLYASGFLYQSNYQVRPDWRYKLIAPLATDFESYGKLWVPKSQAEHLIEAEPTQDDPVLRSTHAYCDVLATKHALFRRLGFDQMIEKDRERIARWQALQERVA